MKSRSLEGLDTSLKFIPLFLISLVVISPASAELQVIISGGFSGAYKQMLPTFEKTTGIKVKTLSGASQGSGPQTIKYQLEHGTSADVVILSREGLTELISNNKIMLGTDVDLALAPLGVAVTSGISKPDISSVTSLKHTLLKTKLIVVPGSTSGIYLTNDLFPRLGVSESIRVKVTERGSQATTLLARGEADMAIQPSSELVNVPGIDYVGRLPDDVQLVQVFTAAIVNGTKESASAKKLIQFLTSDQAISPIKDNGLDLVKK